MKGNQVMLNSDVFEHPDNPIKEVIKGHYGDIDPMDVIYMITDEYWKQWRRDLTKSEYPHIYAPGLGTFSLMHGKSKSFLRKLVVKIRYLRITHPEYQVPGTRAYGVHETLIDRFRTTWKQVDKLKIELNKKVARSNKKKIEKYGDKAILKS